MYFLDWIIALILNFIRNFDEIFIGVGLVGKIEAEIRVTIGVGYGCPVKYPLCRDLLFSTTTEIDNARYNNEYNLLPLYEVFDFTLGFSDFIMKIYHKEGFHEIFVKLEIENIQTFRHIEGSEIDFINAMHNPAVGKYDCEK